MNRYFEICLNFRLFVFVCVYCTRAVAKKEKASARNIYISIVSRVFYRGIWTAMAVL